MAEALIQHLAGILLDSGRVDGNSSSATHSLAVMADDTGRFLRLRVAAVPNCRAPCHRGKIQCAQQLVDTFSGGNYTLNQCGPRLAGESVPLSGWGIRQLNTPTLHY